MEVIASRIAGFLKQNPGIQLHLNNLDIDSLAQDREDAQIKYCLHPPAGAYSIELLRERLVPVCNPSLVGELANPEDLLFNPEVPRLHYRDVSDWKRWLSHHNLDEIAANSNLFLMTSTHCWQPYGRDKALGFLIDHWSKTTCSAEASVSCPNDILSPKNPISLYAVTKTLRLIRHCSSSTTGSLKRFRPSVRFRQSISDEAGFGPTMTQWLSSRTAKCFLYKALVHHHRLEGLSLSDLYPASQVRACIWLMASCRGIAPTGHHSKLIYDGESFPV